MNPYGCNPQWLRTALLEREKMGIADLYGESGLVPGLVHALDPTSHIRFCTRIVFNSLYPFAADIIP